MGTLLFFNCLGNFSATEKGSGKRIAFEPCGNEVRKEGFDGFTKGDGGFRQRMKFKFLKISSANQAITASKRINFETPEKPDSVIAFLCDHCFTKPQALNAIRKVPQVIMSNPEKSLLPKLEFFKSKGFSSTDRTLSAIKHSSGLVLVNLDSRMTPNVELLREFTMISVSKLAWKKKIEVYKKWGLSEDEILGAFGKYPWFMMVSEEKITRMMDLLVNKMGLESSRVSKGPQLLSLSFEKRIVPRCLVYQALQAKGLIKKPKISFSPMTESPETRFITKVVEVAKEEATELLKMYEKNLALAN
ncbi:transcription termination factor MTERF15, mitochondrial-like [Rhododendron vialii]|uniref:transcription termination factor MTERF15, mitochondrial-like n=1 Tax=Rhododendron vialii TaxID=182163 RepID=UPI00265FE6EF|nr:transcription termination factor MTERF15, mitochondrial-like [Rhododendron vialii]